MGFTEIDDELARLGEGIDVQAVIDRLGERPEDVDSALEALASGSTPFEVGDRPRATGSVASRGERPVATDRPGASERPVANEPQVAASQPPDEASEPRVAASEPPESEAEMASFDMQALLAEAADSDAPPAPARSIPPPVPAAALDADALFADLEAEVSIADSPEESTSIFSEADIQAIRRSSAPPAPGGTPAGAPFGDDFEDEVTEFFTGDIELVMDEELAEEPEEEASEGDKKGFFKKLFG